MEENLDEYQAKSEKNIEILPSGIFVIRDITTKKISKRENLKQMTLPGRIARTLDCGPGFLEGDINVKFEDMGDYYLETATTVSRASPEAFLQIASAVRVHHDNFLMAMKGFEEVKTEWAGLKPFVEKASEIRKQRFEEKKNESKAVSTMQNKPIVQREE